MPNFKRLFAALAATLFTLLSACGGGSNDIGGTISGLTASGLVLSNGSTTLGIAANSTSFSFPTLTDGTAYNVTVVTQPTGLLCTVANGSGTTDSAATAVTVVVTCSPVYSISGSTGSTVKGSGLVLSDGTDSINVAAGAATFAFPTLLKTGATYAVTVTTQPTVPTQSCAVTGGDTNTGSGTIGTAAVTNVVVTCTP